MGRAAVTGASGFIGTHLVQRLASLGVPVTGLDVAPPRQPLPPDVEAVECDVREPQTVQAALRRARPEVVYHLAAQVSVSASMRDPAADIAVNVLGTVQVAQAAVAAGARRLVFVSTGGALYGEPAHVSVTEAAVPAPASVYGASKLAAERYLPLVAPQLELSIVRPANVYGPGQDPHGEAGVVAIFAQRMLRDEPVTIFGDGGQQRDYVYVDDVVEACLAAATGPPTTCLIGTGRLTGTREVFDLTAELTGYRREPVFAAERAGDIQRIALDASLAAERWGWQPRTTLEDGLAVTIAAFRAAVGGA